MPRRGVLGIAVALCAAVTPGAASETVSYTLVVTTCKLRIGDVWTWTRCYNGTVPGPTLRVRPGQVLRVSLLNNLSDAGNTGAQELQAVPHGDTLAPDALQKGYNRSFSKSAEGTGSFFGSPNSTNLHCHGLVATGRSPADDVTITVEPGGRFDYAFPLPPEHMAGTHWYHPHRHHSTAGQQAGGMFGALIVEDPPGTLPPTLEAAQERIVFASTLEVKMQSAVARMSMDRLWQMPPMEDVTMVNGTIEPRMRLQAGVWYRFRFIYASMFSALRMSLDPQGSTCATKLVAKDGVYLGEVPRDVNKIWLSSGNRADVAVTCSCDVGASRCGATFRSERLPREAAQLDSRVVRWGSATLYRTWVGDVFHLDIEGDSAAPAFPSFRVNAPCYLADLRRLATSQLSPANRVELNLYQNLSQDTGLRGPLAEQHLAAHKSIVKGIFGIVFNGTLDRMLWAGGREVGTIPFDEVQEWTIIGTGIHPFHLHGQPFQIARMPSQEDMAEQLISLNFKHADQRDELLNRTVQRILAEDDGWYKEGDWADTFYSPGSRAVLRFAPRVPDLGNMVFHCHFLTHEDQGMMSYVKVAKGGPACASGAQCASALDPQCHDGRAGAGFTLTVPPGEDSRARVDMASPRLNPEPAASVVEFLAAAAASAFAATACWRGISAGT